MHVRPLTLLSACLIITFIFFSAVSGTASPGPDSHSYGSHAYSGTGSPITPSVSAQGLVKKENLTSGEKKLSTDLVLLLHPEQANMTGQARADLIHAMKVEKQVRSPGKPPGSGNDENISSDLVYVYISVYPKFSTEILDPHVEEVVSRDEDGNLVAAWVMASDIDKISEMPQVRSIRTVIPPVPATGSVTTEGDAILRSDLVRALASGPNGTGIKVGVISDGVDNRSTAIATGDLPASLQVLNNTIGGDEGTAMAEIIYDIVPGSSLAFSDCGSNSAQFAQRIQELVNAGCKVICDDITYVDQPFFEPGVIAQKINTVTAANNIIYVSSAGNFQQKHYQGLYYPQAGGNWHDFSHVGTASINPTPDFPNLYLTVGGGNTTVIVLQWDDQFGHSGNDYDLYLMTMSGDILAQSTNWQTGTGDPIELITYYSPSAPFDVQVFVDNYEGWADTRTLEVYISNAVEVYTNNIVPSDAIPEHHGAAGTVAVGAISALDPGYDTIEPYSSFGPVTQRYPSSLTLNKPDITGIDQNMITGAGGFGEVDPEGHYRFPGTSASAPHIAGIAALLWSKDPAKSPDQIKSAINGTAIDLGATGWDPVFGSGRPDSLAAYNFLYTPTTPPASVTNLHNTTYRQTYITWNWTDPVSADFDRVMVYLDGVFRTNVTKGVQGYNATSLTANTAYTLSTKTVGTTGLINSTWVNHTARTAPVPPVPPASVTGLVNSTYRQTYITWNWTDPVSADFDRVMVYLDGVFRANVTKGVQGYNATSLTANTAYTLSTKTVGTTGLINTTWVNHTARTAPVPPVPPVSVSGLQNTTYRQTYITWNWTDPVSADFDRVMVYLDGVFRTNVTKGVQGYNATSLTADTAYTVSTKTVGTTGLINSTWVNHTARTAPVPPVPPASVTNLQNTTYRQTYITWNWTDPVSADFDRVMVYLDGVFRANVTKGVQGYNATSLTANTAYTLSTKTVGTTGLINTTWVNHTARTAPVPPVPPVSVSGLQNTTYRQTYITWNWTDPVSADFDRVMVYLDGVFRTNVTKGVQGYNATSLTADTAYTISTKTVGTTGLINSTWVNHTARTAPVPPVPPASVSGLQNTTYRQTYITWNWTDPVSADFDRVMVYLDGVFRTNVTKGVQGYNATSLTADTAYTISTKTVGTTGLINSTWVNHTARTAPVPPVPPASVTGLVNTTYRQTYITWNWTDPVSADFDKVMVYLDGVFRTNVTKGVRGYNATSLAADTAYTISTKTVGTTGLINSTWVNHTARTAPVPPVPPANVTNLQNTTYRQTYITWNWTDPVSADFDRVMVYLDGVFRANVTKGVQGYNATSLTADTAYTISTKTVGTTGLINSTWVNHTARTAPVPPVPPASVTGLVNTTYRQTYITWNWTDPVSADFDRVMVYLDGVFRTNVTKGVQGYNATSLTANTAYTISTKTVGTTGLINSTWVNHTARTAPVPPVPPASVTGLVNTTYRQTYITWNWTDPVSADFDKVMVYLDGVFRANVTKGVQGYNATSLTADTAYTISTKTVGTTGLINSTWVNHTARTAPVPPGPPASVTGLQNTTYRQTYITWNWTDPVSADFDKVIVYLDGVFRANVTKGVQGYNATSLTADTAYTVSTKTVGTTGLINSTWVNHTARTAPVPPVPPVSVSGLQNTTYRQTYITWNWTDPVSADFDRVMVYLDGVFRANVTKGVQGYNATSLTADTAYTISTKTVGTTGLINSTWVNHTARTAPVPPVPPASVTNLQNTTYRQTYITWNWTDPVSADFDRVMVYLDGAFRTNVTKGVQGYNATSLTADTAYTISTKTVGTTGLINSTWVNHTARTAPVPPVPPASVSGLQNTTYRQTYITWNWTDPVSADFDRVMVYLDGVFRANVTKGVQGYNATSLTADTAYTISTKTVGTTGLINTTWVNHTARTAPVPPVPPVSVSGLQNTTYRQTYITWNWTDPVSADFDRVMVYLDGVFRANVTKGVQGYNATSLTADTAYTISTKTVGTTGLINSTWVNHTARTAPVPPVPPVSVSGLQNTTYRQTYITWNWKDPVSADFDRVMVYLDGVFRTNVTKGVQGYNATSLTADTAYTISTKTVGTTGLINSTWVNHTARTAPVPPVPPASVTGLVNTTYRQTYITWNWTDPVSADFDKVMVYLDGVFRANVTKGVQGYNATSLTADTAYTISTKTVGTTGLINTTWVNHTARTAPVPPVPPVSVSGLQNMTYRQTYITWNWTDPVSADFDRVMVYLDGVFRANVTKGVQGYNATSLTADTAYTISTKTVGTTGLINTTWVNHTARTAPVPPVPPASVTGLVNSTYRQTYITWNWTDPVSADFDRVMVYLDGVFRTNVTKGVQGYNATSLTADTAYTISTKTVGTTGLINSTWVNHTARTAPVTPVPPVSVSGLQNTTYRQTYITWNWTDPVSADFDKVMVYLDGVFRTNVTKGVRGYNATSLTADTAYTISTRTVGTTGLINSTWVNHTARTAPAIIPFPGMDFPPNDTDHDGLYEDTNGNGRKDFNDVVLLFKYLEWVRDNEPIQYFDFNHNGRMDFNDIVLQFKLI